MSVVRTICITGLLAACAVLRANAGSVGNNFNVNIVLSNSAGPATSVTGACTSTSLSAKTQATVQVVCATGQFVSIESTPGKRFVGTHGGAYRYSFVPSTVWPGSLVLPGDPYIGSGTVTGLRVVNLNALEDHLELLVSF